VSLDCEVVVTQSGARAMRDRVTGEVMHPVVGPLVEAERLYLSPSRLKSRLSEPGVEPLVLLDVGLGAGSNAALAFQVSESLTDSTRVLVIESFDRSTAALEVALEPQNASAFGLVGTVENAARELVRVGSHVTSRTRWHFRQGDALSTLEEVAEASADIVFWDPFSPRKNPELWSLAAFRSLRRVCRRGATLHTYSGSTAVRSALLLAGFCVGVGVGIGPGKASTIAALETEELANPLDQRWLERLGRSSSAFPPDAPADAWERVRSLSCFQVK
jgi:queuine tRNA-ribosyltransferase